MGRVHGRHLQSVSVTIYIHDAEESEPKHPPAMPLVPSGVAATGPRAAGATTIRTDQPNPRACAQLPATNEAFRQPIVSTNPKWAPGMPSSQIDTPHSEIQPAR